METMGLKQGTRSVHLVALDGLVSVNSVFTIAIFVGLSITPRPPTEQRLEGTAACALGPDVVQNLLVFEVVAFSFFVFSSIVAHSLKLAINLPKSRVVDDAGHINTRFMRFGVLGSAAGSIMGCIFLMLIIVDVIQVRLGMLSCGSSAVVGSAVALIVLVSTALIIYMICVILYVFSY